MVPGNSIFAAVGGILGGLPRRRDWRNLWESRAWREPRPWLSPLVPLYAGASLLHRAWMRARSTAFAPRIPMIVVGSLRAGGSGKTAVAAALARRYRDRGLDVAVLAYRLGPGRRRGGPPPGILLPVAGGLDWRVVSDEAAMLGGIAGIRVFATRDRLEAWRALQDGAAGKVPDLVISDDGFQDPRLSAAFRLLLAAPGERPRFRDLLPAGPFRETASARRRASLVLEGPLRPEASGPVGPAGASRSRGPEVLAFHRRILPPPGADRSLPWAALCGLGDNRAFVAALAAEGFPPRDVLSLRDHGAPSERRLAAFARRNPGAGILCTRKDWVKLGPGWAERYGILAVDEEMVLPEAALAALDRHLAPAGDAPGPGNGAVGGGPAGLSAGGKLVH